MKYDWTIDQAFMNLDAIKNKIKNFSKHDCILGSTRPSQQTVELANDLYAFISKDGHKVLGMSIKDCAEQLKLGKDSTVRFYAKLGMVNECCSILGLEYVSELEAGKILSANLQVLGDDGELQKARGYQHSENEMLVQRVRLYHQLLNEN